MRNETVPAQKQFSKSLFKCGGLEGVSLQSKNSFNIHIQVFKQHDILTSIDFYSILVIERNVFLFDQTFDNRDEPK